MRSFSRFALRALAFVVCFVLLEKLAAFCIVPVSFYYADEITRDRKATDGAVDLVFLGNSRGYSGFVPEVFDEVLGVNSFNCATSSQSTKGAYFYLRDMLTANPVETVVLGLCPSMVKEYASVRSIAQDVIVHHRIQDPAVKLDQLRASFTLDTLPYLLFDSLNCRANLRPNKILKIVQQKLDPDNMPEAAHYGHKGFIFKAIASDTTGWGRAGVPAWSEENIKSECFEYLDKIIDLCAEEGLELILALPPVTNVYLDKMGNYDEFHAFLAELADEADLPLFDFNYARIKLDELPDALFNDANHLSGVGAERFSLECARVLRDYFAGMDTSGYFFDSYAQLQAEAASTAAAALQ